MGRVALLLSVALLAGCSRPTTVDVSATDSRSEVVFWHFWGGRDLPVVEDAVRRFNESQAEYRVRAVAMPGANLDLKLFLAIAGGQPPDLMNHDDPVVPDWAHRGALTPLDELADKDELARLREWLLPAARRLGEYGDRLYALVNGLDIRALYYNRTALRNAGLGGLAEDGPQTLADLDRIAEAIAPSKPNGGDRLQRVGYLPDPRRLWAWGVVFGGRFGDPDATGEGAVTIDSPPIVRALQWMAGYRDRYGADRLATFRSGDQALTGASFPLLADRRYAVMMDGQWRVRDLAEARRRAKEAGQPIDDYGVCPLPPPPGGVARAGWVNGNFFIVPRGANNSAGAWAFMKFWTGFTTSDSLEAQEQAADAAAETAAAGGWIPPSKAVAERPRYRRLVATQPEMRVFLELAASPHQTPVPALPVASVAYREVVAAAQDVLYRGEEPARRLRVAADRVRSRLAAVEADTP